MSYNDDKVAGIESVSGMFLNVETLLQDTLESYWPVEGMDNGIWTSDPETPSKRLYERRTPYDSGFGGEESFFLPHSPEEQSQAAAYRTNSFEFEEYSLWGKKGENSSTLLGNGIFDFDLRTLSSQIARSQNGLDGHQREGTMDSNSPSSSSSHSNPCTPKKPKYSDSENFPWAQSEDTSSFFLDFEKSLAAPDNVNEGFWNSSFNFDNENFSPQADSSLLNSHEWVSLFQSNDERRANFYPFAGKNGDEDSSFPESFSRAHGNLTTSNNINSVFEISSGGRQLWCQEPDDNSSDSQSEELADLFNLAVTFSDKENNSNFPCTPCKQGSTVAVDESTKNSSEGADANNNGCSASALMQTTGTEPQAESPGKARGDSSSRNPHRYFPFYRRYEYDCAFCRKSNQSEEVCRSHPLRLNDTVTCPMLRSHVCSICKATGDNAHTIKYCPFNSKGHLAKQQGHGLYTSSSGANTGVNPILPLTNSSPHKVSGQELGLDVNDGKNRACRKLNFNTSEPRTSELFSTATFVKNFQSQQSDSM